MKLLIDGKSRKIMYNKKENMYYYNCKGNKVDSNQYFLKGIKGFGSLTEGSLKKHCRKMLVGGGTSVSYIETEPDARNNLVKLINANVYLLEEVDVKQSLKTAIKTKLSLNTLSLDQLTTLSELIMAIVNKPNDSVGYYTDIYHMLNLRNPFPAAENIGIY